MMLLFIWRFENKCHSVGGQEHSPIRTRAQRGFSVL